MALGRLPQPPQHQGPLSALLLPPTPQVSSTAAFSLNKKYELSLVFAAIYVCAGHKVCMHTAFCFQKAVLPN